MTELDRLDRDLAAWFGEAATPRVPDYVDDILRQTAPLRQRPRWTFPERWLPMTVVTLERRVRRPVPWRTIGAIALFVALLAAIVAVYVGSQRRLAPPFGVARNGVVAYVQTATPRTPAEGALEAFGTLMTVDAATGVAKPLPGGSTSDGEPAFSLDGSRLAFVRQVAGGRQLHAIDARGGTPIALSDVLTNIRGIAWSPDGTRIAFTSDDGQRSHLWIARTDGSGTTMLDLPFAVALPQWRPPDGRELLVVGSPDPGLMPAGEYQGIYMDSDGPTGSNIQLYLVRPDGSGVRPITTGESRGYNYGHIGWTPDGSRIVTHRGSADTFWYPRVVVLADDGRLLHEFGLDPADARFTGTMAPIVSPDGTKVAYVAIDARGLWQARVRAVDGIGPVTKTGPEYEGAGAIMRWSPDGTALVVNHHYWGQTWLLDPAGGRERQASWTDPGYAAFQRLAP